MHKELPFLKDYYKRAARRETLDTPGTTVTVLDFDAETGVPWQAWVFSAESSTGACDVVFELRGGFATDGEIRITVPPGGGDLITGTGACTVQAVGRAGGTVVDLSVWFVPEQTVRALPPFAQRTNIPGAAPITQSFGFPPFGRYKCSIISPAGYTFEIRDTTGLTIFTQAVTGGALFLDDQYFYWPPNCELFLTSTINNQRFIVSNFQ